VRGEKFILEKLS